MFKLRGKLTTTQKWILFVAGLVFLFIIWMILSWGENPIARPNSLPSPKRVFFAFADLYYDNDLIQNTFLSIGLNLAGYVEALLIAIPVGFIIGLLPIMRGLFHSETDALRYIPLTALIGSFIIWFGTGTPMKVHFLALGIIIYLLPVIIQRIDEVNDTYLKTVYTLGATDWQTVKTVYIPSVLSRVSDDIRVLTAISWTYIIVAEGLGNQGGLGALIWRAGLRQSRMDKIFAILIIIMLIGVLQDKLAIYLDRKLFPHKYQQADSHKKGKIEKETVFQVLLSYVGNAFVWIMIGIYGLLFLNEWTGMITDIKIFEYLFKDTSWAIHVISITLIASKLYLMYRKKKTVPKIAVSPQTKK